MDYRAQGGTVRKLIRTGNALTKLLRFAQCCILLSNTTEGRGTRLAHICMIDVTAT